jgi:hypothetical protein
MASIIRIKRSSGSSAPAILGDGELAYSSGSGKLYIGFGTEVSGGAPQQTIGGKYYTDLMSGIAGTLKTDATSVPILDATGKINKFFIGGLAIGDLGPNTISAVSGDITIAPNSSTAIVRIAGTNQMMIPAGTTAQRTTPAFAGAVRFNTDTTSFEGYSGSNWSSLGGVRSVDGLTYITAESSPGASDDTLRFYTDGTIAMALDTDSLDIDSKIATVNINSTTASSSTTTGALVVDGGVGIAGNVYIGGNLSIAGTDLNIGSVQFNQGLTLSGSTTPATEYFRITDGAATPITKFLVDTANGNTSITGTLSAGASTLSSATISNNASVGGTLVVTGNTTLNGTLAAGASTLASASITGNATVGGTFGVTGATTLAALSATTGSFSSTLSSTGDFAVNTNKFTVTAASGNTSVAGTLGVTGATSLNNTLGVSGATTLSSTLGVTGAATFSSTANVDGNFSVATNKFNVVATSGNTSIAGTLGVTGATTLAALSATSGTFSTTLGVSGAATFSSTVSSLGNFDVATNKFTVNATSGNTQIAGTLGLTGDLAINVNKFTVAATSGNTAIAGTLNVSGATTLSSNLAMSGNTITGLADPVNPQDAATKNYVDAARSGLDVKQSVRVTTTGNITLSGTQTIDGIAVVSGDRVLVKDQTTASQNGIYIVANGAWTRSSDADANAEVTSGLFTFVEEGNTQAATGWVLTSTGTLTVGTSPLTFGLFSITNNIAAGAGLIKNGNQFDVQVGTGIAIVADTVTLASTVAGAGLTFTGGVVDVIGTANRITVNADSIDIASTYVGQSSITTLGTITTGVWNGTTIGAGYGGTGQSSYSTGDLLVASGASTLSKLSVGVSGKVLQSNGTTLVYGDVDGGTY